MRPFVIASLLLEAAFHHAIAQSVPVVHEFRYQVLVTLPRVHGFAGTLIVEEHVATDDLAPTEQIQGLGVISPLFHRMSLASEIRQVVSRGAVEHRYVQTMNSITSLVAGFEIRNRARIEVRDIATTWSHRYVDRATLGHDVDLVGRSLFPYVQSNLSYDSRYSMINRIETSIGVRVPITSGTSVDSYVTRSSDVKRSPLLLVAGGVIMRVAL